MAVGDVVADYYTAATDFQPASGVSIVITTLFGITTSSRLKGRGDIDTASSNLQFGTGGGINDNTVTKWQGYLFKLAITNSAYLNFTESGFSGIQIQ